MRVTHTAVTPTNRCVNRLVINGALDDPDAGGATQATPAARRQMTLEQFMTHLLACSCRLVTCDSQLSQLW